jgi:hypothetical protein
MQFSRTTYLLDIYMYIYIYMYTYIHIYIHTQKTNTQLTYAHSHINISKAVITSSQGRQAAGTVQLFVPNDKT